VKTTNYFDSFIAVAADCQATRGETPAKPGSIGALQLELMQAQPYGLTSDELLFEVHARRRGLADADRASERAAFFARSQACLRSSPLVKTHGWGLHHDAEGRIAAYGVETGAYRELAGRTDLKQVPGMRNRRV
jgi:hypothetical protein